MGRLGGSVSQASAFSSGHDPRVLGLSPASGSFLGRESASPSAYRSPCLCFLSLSLSLTNKWNLKNKQTNKQTKKNPRAAEFHAFVKLLGLGAWGWGRRVIAGLPPLKKQQPTWRSHIKTAVYGAPGLLSQLSIQLFILAQVMIPGLRASPALGSTLGMEPA